MLQSILSCWPCGSAHRKTMPESGEANAAGGQATSSALAPPAADVPVRRIVSAEPPAYGGGGAAVSVLPTPPQPASQPSSPPAWLAGDIPPLCKAILWQDRGKELLARYKLSADEIADAHFCKELKLLVQPEDDVTRAAIYHAYKHGKVHALAGLLRENRPMGEKLSYLLTTALGARAWAFARALVKAGAQAAISPAQANAGLRDALAVRNLSAVTLLIELGACASLVGEQSTTSLLLALQKSDANAVHTILLAGASVGSRETSFLFELPKAEHLKLACVFAKCGHLAEIWHLAEQLDDGDLVTLLREEYSAGSSKARAWNERAEHCAEPIARPEPLPDRVFNSQTLGFEPINSIDPRLRIVVGGHFIFDIREIIQTIGAAHGTLKNPYTGEFLSQADIAAIANHPSGLGSALQEVLKSNLHQYLDKHLVSVLMSLTQAVLRERERRVKHLLQATCQYLDTCPAQERLAVDRAVFVASDAGGPTSQTLFTIRSFLLELGRDVSCSKVRLAFHLHRALHEHRLSATAS